MFIWMLEETRLYLLNASARENYLNTHESNTRAWLVNDLVEKKGLDAGRSETEIWKSMDKFILESIALVGVDMLDLLRGRKPLSNANALVLSKTNKKQPPADYPGGEMTTIARKVIKARPVGFKIWVGMVAAQGQPSVDEVPIAATRSQTSALRVVRGDLKMSTHDGVPGLSAARGGGRRSPPRRILR